MNKGHTYPVRGCVRIRELLLTAENNKHGVVEIRADSHWLYPV